MRATLLVFLTLGILPTHVRAEENRIGLADVKKLPSPFRIRAMTEMMFPALDGSGSYVPKPGSEPFVPAFLSAQMGLDCLIGEDFRVFYLQKGLVISPKQPGAGLGGRFLDPRLGIRKARVLPVDHLSTEYDLFFQPGIASAFVVQPQRSFDLGVRATHRYTSPGSNFTLGFNFELVFTLYSAASRSSDLTGVIAPWASYRISKRFSTQHWVYGFYKHMRGDDLGTYAWDITGAPYLQNGLTYELSEQVGVSFLLNHYLLEAPTLRSTWSSLWVSFKF